MTALLLAVDFFVYSLTFYKTHFVVLAIPYAKNFYPFFIYFLILSFYDYHFLWNLLIVYLLYKVDRFLNERLRDTLSVGVAKILLYYTIYFLLLGIIKKIL